MTTAPTTPIVGSFVWCERHAKETRVHSLVAGLVYLRCGCFWHTVDVEEVA